MSVMHLVPDPNTAQEKKGKHAKEKIDNTLTEEVVIGVCSTIGSVKGPVIEALRKRFSDYGYEFEVIKLSKFIGKHDKTDFKLLPGETQAYSELHYKIEGGNRLRQKHTPSVLAELAISHIHSDRMARHQTKPGELPEIQSLKSRRKCYLIDSIKNKDELALLRSVYRDIFYFFSIFSPLDERKSNLSDQGLAIHEITSLIINADFHC